MSEERLEPYLVEQYRAFVSVGLTAFKLVFLINAGAAIAVLALIANLVQDNLRLSTIFAHVVFIFGCGALSTVWSAVAAFISGYGEDFTSGKFSIPGQILGLMSVTLLFAGTVIFAYGLYELVDLFLLVQKTLAK